ncbi:hypothetical protein [Granulibacter bethesdensis]|uniref:hypothetical protein n=1 Tax=Granulibacter bethesdensis TaxID=364410 RepID=UPI0004B3E59C|nr:hypothetical protein [Granulibacter bethesdensis]
MNVRLPVRGSMDQARETGLQLARAGGGAWMIARPVVVRVGMLMIRGAGDGRHGNDAAGYRADRRGT